MLFLRAPRPTPFWCLLPKAVDREAVCIVVPKVFTSEEDIDQQIIEQLKTPSGERAFRTRPALFWEAMAEKYAKPPAATQVIRIAYLTDGGNDWQADAPRIAKAAQVLSQNSQVGVVLVGLDPEELKLLEKQFAPFGKRVLFVNRGGENTALAAWLDFGR